MSAISRDEQIRHDQWHAFEMLAKHELLAEDYFDDGRCARWVIGRPGSFFAKCEIIAGIGGSLIVHGDFEMVRFGHYGDHADAFSRLCWMGLCYDVGYYVAQKASIGSGGKRKVWVWDPDVAQHDLDRLLADPDAAYSEALEEAGDHLEAEESFWQYLYENDLHDHAGHTFGKTLDSHVVISHVALNRLACMLIEQHGAAGPPQCRAEKIRRAS